MAIKFKCPKCGKELTVKDELAGRQGKCPFCKTVVTVPAAHRPKSASAVAPTPARKPASRPAPAEEEEVIDAEVVDEEEEVVEAEVIDEPAPKRKSSRETSPDDFDVPSKKSSAPARRSSRRDDDDDEEDEDDRPRSKSRRRDDDDDDEEEDERPRKKSRQREGPPSRKKASARRQRDDYDDEEEDDDPKARKARARARRALYRKAGTGCNLCFIGMACYTGAWALLTVVSLILSVMALVGAGRGGLDLLRVVGYLMDGLLVINWILFVVGSCFLIFDPGRNGEKGLAITTLILSVLALGAFLYLRFASNVEMVLLLLMTAFGMGFGADIPIIIYFFPMIELGRLSLFGFYCKAVAVSQKESELESSSMMLSMAVPGAIFGFVVVMWVMIKIVAAAQSEALFYLAWFIMDSMLGGITGLLAWYTMNTQIVKDTLDEGK